MLKTVPVHSLVCVMTSIHNQNIFSQPPPKYYHRIWLYKEMGVLLGGEGLLHTCIAFKAGFLWCILPPPGGGGGRGYFPKIPSRVCATQWSCDFGHPF